MTVLGKGARALKGVRPGKAGAGTGAGTGAGAGARKEEEVVAFGESTI